MDKALNRGYVLLPLAAPHRPPGRAGLHQALDRASSLGPLPAAVEAPPRMTHEHSGGADPTAASAASHELLSSKHKSSSLADTARTAASGVKQQCGPRSSLPLRSRPNRATHDAVTYADRRFCTPPGGPWFRRQARLWPGRCGRRHLPPGGAGPDESYGERLSRNSSCGERRCGLVGRVLAV